MTLESIFDWMEIFKSSSAKTVEILPKNPYLCDGLLRYRCAGKSQAIELKRETSDNSGSCGVTLVLLLEGSKPDLFPGDKIIVDNNSYILARVEICRAVSGEIIARRCVVK